MRLLVTRPKDDAAPLMTELKARGIDAVLAPLLTINFFDGSLLDLSGVQALLMSSANGVRAFAGRSGKRALPLVAVGDATARVAKDLGFGDVASATGDVDNLAQLATEKFDPEDGALMHPVGTNVAGDLARRLRKAGFDYRREVLYEAETAGRLPVVACEGLRNGDFDGVLIYSPRTGRTFKRLAEAEGLGNGLASVRAYCLSKNVAEAVSGLAWASILTADRPEQVALLNLFDET